VSFIGGVPNLPQVTDKLYHILANNVISSTSRHERGKKTDSFPKDLLVIIPHLKI
jgi:hypothetical protein